MPQADHGVVGMRVILRGAGGEEGAAVVEAGPGTPAGKEAGTATLTFGTDGSPLTATSEVASETEIVKETGTVSATETGIATGTETAIGIGVIAILTGLAGRPQAGADHHRHATSVAGISHLV